jgi:ABC-type transporter Mla subunit MlaD
VNENDTTTTVTDHLDALHESIQQFAMELADLGATGQINLALNSNNTHDTGERPLKIHTSVLVRITINPPELAE